MNKNFTTSLISKSRNSFFILALHFGVLTSMAQNYASLNTPVIRKQSAKSMEDRRGSIANTLSISPVLNEVRVLSLELDLGSIRDYNPANEIYVLGNDFILKNIKGMNGNALFYDMDGDSILDKGEQLYANDTVFNFNPRKLSALFSGDGSTELQFYYTWLDSAGFAVQGLSSYRTDWAVPVPIELINLQAELIGNVVTLTWDMASETDNRGFIVLRSTTRSESYEPLGFIEGVGTSSVLSEYHFSDKKANPQKMGSLCYKLIQVDYNGRSELSEIICLDFDQKITTVMSPNPVSSIVNDKSAAEETTSDIQSNENKDVKGKALKGDRKTRINVASLLLGTSIIKIIVETLSADHLVDVIRQ